MSTTAEWTDKPAGFWIRWMAQFVDSMVVTIPVMILYVVISVVVTLSLRSNPQLAVLIGVLVLWALALVGSAAYFTLMTARDGQTLGKKLFNLKVVRNDGSLLSWQRALGRWGAYIISYIPLLIGFIIAAFTDDKRALHDYVVDSKVRRVGPMSTGAVVAAWVCGFFFLMIPVGGIVAAIAIPSFSHMLGQAKDAATKGNLGAIRSATSIYYAENGRWPSRLEDLVEGKLKYIDAIPMEKIKNSNRTVSVFDGTGGWFYDPKTGTTLLNVDGEDSKGHLYRDYGNE